MTTDFTIRVRMETSIPEVWAAEFKEAVEGVFSPKYPLRPALGEGVKVRFRQVKEKKKQR